MNWENIARFGYEAYAKSTGWKTFDGRDMPPWADLPRRTIDAWIAAAQEIVQVAHAAATA
jgi:hypothetical protein